jgi:uncharacterized protein (DUF362 family)/Pyruvate/2-oxoacid:ferredoxin oxidoreductase delta subunit
MREQVALALCPDYAYRHVLKGVMDALHPLGGMKAFVHKGDRVLIKPNLLVAKDADRCVTTNPAVVKAVIHLVREAGGVPAIGDSPAVGGLHRVAARAGIAAVAQEYDCPLVEFREAVRVSPGKDYTFRRFELAKAILDADVVINLPKVKTHSMMLLTLGVKNMFGCVPGMRKAQWHLRAGVDHASFAGMLVELCRLVRPALTIADGIMGMEGEGPGSGNPRQLGLLVASGNPYALDTAICRIIGAPLEKAPTIQAARQRGFAGADPKHIEVLGHRIKNGEITPFRLPTRFDAQWNLPRFVKKSLTHAFVPKPVIKEALCKVCMACGEVCPPQAISVRDKKINIDYRSCIRCYCCQEVCPEGAVRLQAGWFARLSS